MKGSLVFAYGSNLDLDQMRSRCEVFGIDGKARLEDFKLAFGGYSHGWGGGVATVVPAPGQHVAGVVYRLPKAALERLDRFEGHPHVYSRIRLSVRSKSARLRSVFVYVLVNPFENAPSSKYLSVIRRAFDDWGLDRSLLRAAVPSKPVRLLA